MMADSSTLQVHVESGVLRVCFNRPDQMNALDDRMGEELALLFREFNPDQIKIIVLTGAGGNFMAGADLGRLESWREIPSSEVADTIRNGFSATTVARLPVPVVAAVDGVALGVGFDICQAADVVIATDRAVFGLPEVEVGLVPLGGSTWELTQRLGSSRAGRVIMCGERIKAGCALEWGLVASVVSPDELEPTVERYVAKLLSRSQNAMRAAKRLLRATRDDGQAEAAEAELSEFIGCLGTTDVLEGIAAIRERRRPNFEAAR